MWQMSTVAAPKCGNCPHHCGIDVLSRHNRLSAPLHEQFKCPFARAARARRDNDERSEFDEILNEIFKKALDEVSLGVAQRLHFVPATGEIPSCPRKVWCAWRFMLGEDPVRVRAVRCVLQGGPIDVRRVSASECRSADINRHRQRWLFIHGIYSYADEKRQNTRSPRTKPPSRT